MLSSRRLRLRWIPALLRLGSRWGRGSFAFGETCRHLPESPCTEKIRRRWVRNRPVPSNPENPTATTSTRDDDGRSWSLSRRTKRIRRDWKRRGIGWRAVSGSASALPVGEVFPQWWRTLPSSRFYCCTTGDTFVLTIRRGRVREHDSRWISICKENKRNIKLSLFDFRNEIRTFPQTSGRHSDAGWIGRPCPEDVISAAGSSESSRTAQRAADWNWSGGRFRRRWCGLPKSGKRTKVSPVRGNRCRRRLCGHWHQRRHPPGILGFRHHFFPLPCRFDRVPSWRQQYRHQN